MMTYRFPLKSESLFAKNENDEKCFLFDVKSSFRCEDI